MAAASNILTIPTPRERARVECGYCFDDSPRREYVFCDCGSVICDDCQTELEYLLGTCKSEDCKCSAVNALQKKIGGRR
jgi:hypothetical protein